MPMRTLIAVFSLLLVVGCSNTKTVDSLTAVPEQPRSTTQRHPSIAAAPTPSEDGRDIFVANCLGCHGRNADGDTPAGRNWHVPNLRSPQVQSLGDDALRHTIHEGKGKMPAWGALLSQTDIDHLVAYVRTFKTP
jgi:mono/diheme cytochrome c family protein